MRIYRWNIYKGAISEGEYPGECLRRIYRGKCRGGNIQRNMSGSSNLVWVTGRSLLLILVCEACKRTMTGSHQPFLCCNIFTSEHSSITMSRLYKTIKFVRPSLFPEPQNEQNEYPGYRVQDNKLPFITLCL